MTKLLVPEGRTGQLSCSASGKNYNIDETGHVEVDQCDVADLLRAGFAHEGDELVPVVPPAVTFVQEPAPKTADEIAAAATKAASESDDGKGADDKNKTAGAQ